MPLHAKEKSALRFLAAHLVLGAVAAGIFSAGMLAMDLGGLRGLIFAGSHPVAVTFLLYFGLFITFGGVAMAVGIMSMGPGAGDDG